MEIYQEHYQAALLQANRRLLAQYNKRLDVDPEAARSEAAVFCLFEKLTNQIDINESPSEGGPDFKCTTETGVFSLEATCLKVSAIETESGIPNRFLGSGSFKPIGRKLFQKTISKARQLCVGTDPGVLAITTEHTLGSTLMGIAAAKSLLLGKSVLSFTINEPSSRATLATELQDSIFYASPEEQSLHHILKQISAVLLMPISERSCHAVLIVNPSPTVPLQEDVILNICSVAVEKEPAPKDPTFNVAVRNQSAWGSLIFFP